jgi:hypothetical protein
MRDWLYGTVLTIAFVGFAFAADQRIDTRVQAAINSFNEQQIENQLEFYIIKAEMSGLTPEDKINQKILEKQLEKLRSRR